MSEGSALLTLAVERNGCFESYDGGLSADSNVSEVWASWGGHWSGSRIRGQQTQSTQWGPERPGDLQGSCSSGWRVWCQSLIQAVTVHGSPHGGLSRSGMTGKLLENTSHMRFMQKPVPGGYQDWGVVELLEKGNRTGLVPLETVTLTDGSREQVLSGSLRGSSGEEVREPQCGPLTGPGGY